jgi:hypothetical protein
MVIRKRLEEVNRFGAMHRSSARWLQLPWPVDGDLVGVAAVERIPVLCIPGVI